MKKNIITLAVSFLILFTLCISAQAGSKITEIPDVRFVVNDQLATLSDVPISISNRTLLPLRAVLSSLGVLNDDEHIKWNGNDNSVTIIHNDTKIYLRRDSKTAYINDVPVEMDVAPIGYSKNGRTYVPVRFISKALNKEVIWDGYTKTVYIKDKDKFDKVKSAMTKVDLAMNNINKARINAQMKLDILDQSIAGSFDVSINEELDKTIKTLSSTINIPLPDTNLSFSTYYIRNAEYRKDFTSSKWQKKVLKESDFNKILIDSVNLSAINSIDIISASLEEGVSNNPDELLFKGSGFPIGLFADFNKIIGIDKLKPDRCYLEITINKNTNHINKIYIEFDGKILVNGAYSQVKSTINIYYSNINEDFKIIIPDGLK